MVKHLLLFLTLLSSSPVCMAGAKPAENNRFRTELLALIETSKMLEGFEMLKDVELTTGMWNCKKLLQDFVPVVTVEGYNPVRPLRVEAASSNSHATEDVRQLIAQGLEGYEMKDSDKDKSIKIDKALYSRKVVFTKQEQFVLSRITVLYKAHEFRSLLLIVEAFPIVHPNMEG